MSSPPSFIQVELEEQDVQADLVSIVESMRAIRREELKTENVSKAKKDEYLQLSYRLASTLEGLADHYSITRMQNVVDVLQKNPSLLCYDSLQDDFWRVVEEKFTSNLDELVISSMGDDFNSLEDKHHFFNALKYLASKGEPLADRLPIYDTLLPYHTPGDTQRKVDIERHLKKFGFVKRQGGLRVRTQGTDNLDNLLKAASHLGFSTLEVETTPRIFEASIQTQYPGSSVSEAETASENLSKLSTSKVKRARFLRMMVSLTPVFSDIYITGLPNRYFIKLDNYFKNNGARKLANDYEDWVITGAAFEGLLGAALTGAGFLVRDHMPGFENLAHFLWAYAGLSFASTASRIGTSVARHHIKMNDYCTSDPRGSNALSSILLTSPYMIYDGLKGLFGKSKSLDAQEVGPNAVVVSIPLRRVEREKEQKAEQGVNYHDMLETLATHSLSEKIRDNLVWRMGNHHRQGESVVNAYTKAKLYQEGFQKKQHLSREIGALSVFDYRKAGPYAKISGVITFPDQRYAITAVGNQETISDFQKISEWLGSNSLDGEKGKREFAQLVGATYLHLSRFENGEKTHDYTITQ